MNKTFVYQQKFGSNATLPSPLTVTLAGTSLLIVLLWNTVLCWNNILFYLCFFFFDGGLFSFDAQEAIVSPMWFSLIPRLSCVGGEIRAWYTLHVHAQFSQDFWEFGNFP